MDIDELEWAIEDVKAERELAIAQLVELTIILNELQNKIDDYYENRYE